MIVIKGRDHWRVSFKREYGCYGSKKKYLAAKYSIRLKDKTPKEAEGLKASDYGITGGGLKCDNPNCDFIDMSIEIDDYEKWVNAPCPNCGGNLLTEKDYAAVKMMILIAKLAQENTKEDDHIVTATAHFNGTGNVEIELSEPKDIE